MKKKRILYSELAPDAPVSRVPAPPPPEPAPAVAPSRKPAPEELARALAAARAAELRPAAVPAAVAPTAPPAVVAPVSASRLVRDRVRARKGQLEILLFRVGDERFGIELSAVEEAIDIPPVHHVPEMPPAMLGVITVRGVLTSVYSPAAALGLSLHDGTSALIFRRGRSRLAVVVDEVDDATSLDLSLLRDAPVLDAGDGIVLGVVRQRDALLALVDTDALLAACQATPLLETA
jgi:purine-binding chemotaxis protein CheW